MTASVVNREASPETQDLLLWPSFHVLVYLSLLYTGSEPGHGAPPGNTLHPQPSHSPFMGRERGLGADMGV